MHVNVFQSTRWLAVDGRDGKRKGFEWTMVINWSGKWDQNSCTVNLISILVIGCVQLCIDSSRCDVLKLITAHLMIARMYENLLEMPALIRLTNMSVRQAYGTTLETDRLKSWWHILRVVKRETETNQITFIGSFFLDFHFEHHQPMSNTSPWATNNCVQKKMNPTMWSPLECSATSNEYYLWRKWLLTNEWWRRWRIIFRHLNTIVIHVDDKQWYLSSLRWSSPSARFN